MRKARISSQQLAVLVAVFNVMASLLILPAPMAKTAGPDAWLAGPIGMAVGALPVSILLGLLARRHPGKGFGELAEFCLGKWPGRLAILLVGAFGLFIASLVLRNIMDFSSIALLPGTPSLVIGVLATLAVCYCASADSEVIARLAVLVFLLACLVVGLIILGTLQDMQTSRILPLLGRGVTPVLKAAWPSAGWYAEFLVLAPYVFQVSRPVKTLKSMVVGNLMAAGLLAVLVAVTILVFGHGLTQKFSYPVYGLAREVSIGEFMERMEIILITVWLSGMVLKAAATLWAAARCLSWSAGLPFGKWMSFVGGAGALWLTQIWRSEVHQAWFSSVYWTPYTLPFFIGLPALMLLGSHWRMRQREGVSA